MKTKNILLTLAPKAARCAALAAVALLTAIGCDNTDYTDRSPVDNLVYIDAASQKDMTTYSFNGTVESGQQQLAAQLIRPVEQDITVDFCADASLVATYNARLGTDYAMLDARHYSFSASQTVIRQGRIVSDPVTLDFKDLTALEMDHTYLLPVSIAQVSGGLGTLHGSRTLCYVVRRSSAITTAASLKNNYFEVPGFDQGSPTASVVNDLKQLTFEAIIRVNSFRDANNRLREISTIMGIEQKCLLRIGDAYFNPQQLQFAYQEQKFPNADKSKLLNEGEWYHVAVTLDTEKNEAVMYLDGREHGRAKNYGDGTPVSLGQQKRATPGKNDGDFMFKIGHSYGEPDDMSRMLDGEICEVRIWSVARTAEDIYRDMYRIEDPAQAEGLCAYWKFNEGSGNTVKDWSGHGNDAVAHTDVVWPSGIEVTVKNRE